MNYKMIGKITAPILCIEVVFMIPALLIAQVNHDQNAVMAFTRTMIITLAVAGCLGLATRNAKKGFYAREGLVTTGLVWIVMSVLGCLPFYFSGEIPSFVDSLFETISGFTTTGSSILTDVEKMSRGLLYWRSFTHWVGGMGVLVFLLAIVPLSGKNEGYTLHILRAESPGPSVGKLVPRMRQTAMILYMLYVILTVLDVLFLCAGGMPLFEAVCTAYGTAGTGGFGVKGDSIAGYSPYLQNVTTVFMLLFGVNFSCYYLLLLKRVKDVLHDEELRTYVGIVLVSAILIAINIRGLYTTLGETLRLAFFQVATIITTTGFATADFNQWPALSKTIMVLLMFCGACAGSTGGGIKVARLILLVKNFRRNMNQNLHPTQVTTIRMNGQKVDEKIVSNVSAYLIGYMGIIVVSFLLVSLDNFSLETNLTAVIATFNNIGPGLDMIGPTGNFSAFSDLSKLVLSFDMLAGSLEIFPIVILLSRSVWKK
ncbi:MAG: TrkH family potassium uptake protein [Solobacterium sp.]|nr:TrkH family potassium uptake protein [Solobacterium sp.]